MKDWISEAIRQWKIDGVQLNAGAESSRILQAEEEIDFKFPPDFKELYVEVDGFANLDWTKNMFHLWPLEFIVNEYQASSDKNVIGCCDYLIFSHTLAFKRSEEGIFKNYGPNFPPVELIAPTFSGLIQLINSDDHIIY